MRDVRHSFRPVDRAPLSLLVSGKLREAIVSGDLRDGTELASEKELSEQFGVGRSTIREALRVLQAQGFLSGGDSVSTARPRVSVESTFASASDALENAMRLRQIPLEDLIHLRLLLEGEAVRSADPASGCIAVAREALDQMRAADADVDAFHDADVRFHIALSGCSGNCAFSLVMTVLRDTIAGHLLGALGALPDPVRTLQVLTAEHEAILEALDAGDRDLAKRLLEAHVWGFYTSAVPPDA
ncbi:MAG TPA: FCD domain-containing protein [Acidimicrobiales bacterium]|nr:FCD domain-containing protein [Acidimicrobiales bacterium]